MEKLNIYGETFGEIFEGDNLFDDLVTCFGRDFLEAAENFHTQNNSRISPTEVRVSFLH